MSQRYGVGLTRPVIPIVEKLYGKIGRKLPRGKVHSIVAAHETPEDVTISVRKRYAENFEGPDKFTLEEKEVRRKLSGEFGKNLFHNRLSFL